MKPNIPAYLHDSSLPDSVLPDSVLLDCRAISVFRGERLVLHDLSVDLQAGEALLVTGENGAGKTSFLRSVAGLCSISSGVIRCCPSLAWMGHQNGLKPALTVAENLTLAQKTGGQDLITILNALDLAPLENCPVRLLSSGQKRRVAFARVVLSSARLWLLDEPATGLDAASLARLGKFIARHLAEDGGVIVTSHTSLPLLQPKIITLSPPNATSFPHTDFSPSPFL